jgi:hypothetical protein
MADPIYYPLPENTHSYTYYIITGTSDRNLIYSETPLQMFEDGSLRNQDSPSGGKFQYYLYSAYLGTWILIGDYTNGALYDPSPIIVEANYAIGPYTPPPKWVVRPMMVKGEGSPAYALDWPTNTYNYPYCVVYERWSFYLGIHDGTYQEVIYSAEPCTLTDLGFPNVNIVNEGHFERYYRTKGTTGRWTNRDEYTDNSIYGIREIFYANYPIGDYVPPPKWRPRIARVKLGNANQKWADYPDTPSIVLEDTISGTIVINSENYPYQTIFEMQGNGTTVLSGTYLWVCESTLIKRYSSGAYRLRSTGITPRAFRLVDGGWEYKGTLDAWPILDMYEANHDIIDDDTSGVYFAKSTSPSMDYAPVRWAIRPVKVRVQ